MKFPYKITQPVASLPETASIGEAVQLMIDKNISSVLLTSDGLMVTGILTERDIIRRLTLLDMQDKLTRAVMTIATREVFFADHDHLHETLVRLHFEKRIRHFPVLRGKEPLLENVVGMVTVTDVIRHYLALDVSQQAKKKGAAKKGKPLPVICHHPSQMAIYVAAFTQIGLLPQRVFDPSLFFREQGRSPHPLVLDLDGYQQKDLSNLIVQAKNYPGHLIMVASNLNIVNLFRPYLNKDRQTIASKPLDVEYLCWLLVTKWKAVPAHDTEDIP